MIKKIQLGGHRKSSPIKGYAVVDQEDYDELVQYNWHLTTQGYAARTSRDHETPARKLILMHREILGLPRNSGRGGEQANHKNYDRIDNRRDNLEIVTPGENLRHSWERRKTEACRVCGGTEWSVQVNGGRKCRPCANAAEKRRIERIKADPEKAAALRAYQAAWQRDRSRSDPEYRERQNQATREWRARKARSKPVEAFAT